ncbi:armadillo-type protein [Tuber borchii]|uniref:Armadillo-type protein n=1 Tax=Tuber borchii TaxID=42251 RepID=A0A2T6Z9T9_TUBBO|nr:armadillo-type protein [Tuber borchii]
MAFPATFPAYAPLRSPAEASTISAAPDNRATLQRRFTTDSLKQPQMNMPSSWDPSSFNRMTAEPLDLAPSARQKVEMLQQKQREMELKQLEVMKLREQQKNYEEHMRRLAFQQQEDEREIRRIAQDLDRMTLRGNARLNSTMGRSEPTTPPDHDTFARSRAGHPEANALATPPGTVRHDQQQQQLMTPPADDIAPFISHKASKSMPGSRRNSDENENKGTPEQGLVGQRSSIRNSLPNGSIPRGASNASANLGMETTQVSRIFPPEDGPSGSGSAKNAQSTTSPDIKAFFNMTDPDDKFPILVRHGSNPGMLSASSAPLDLAVPPSKGQVTSANNGWTFSRHHHQHSLPSNSYGAPFTPTSNASPKVTVPQTDSATLGRRFERSSTDLSFSTFSDNINTKISQTEASHTNQNFMPKLQASYSTSDLPTMRTANPVNVQGYGRIAMDRPRHSREPSTSGDMSLSGGGPLAFGPPLNVNIGSMPVMTPGMQSPLPSPGIYGGPSAGLYGGYGNINIGNLTNPAYHMTSLGPFGVHPNYQQAPKAGEGPHQGGSAQNRSVQKRGHDGEANRFANTPLESLIGNIYELCKDQHGCRYLQKKLEERNPQYVQMIFLETRAHVVELMTDPFGNYLCQKLLEYANDEQRTVLVNTAAPQLVKIALNQHGTRALQKMIEYITTPEQIRTVIHALQSKVVELIQDLNGNHVIQKCLNRWKKEESKLQFIFDAVGEDCVAVGTHRHGCCVLQRCIDHAAGAQKVKLIQKITAHAIELVVDPFGNYVVQYILDLADPMLSEPLILKFRGRVCELSKQKFSSNVIEKCIRVAEQSTKKILIEEMLPNQAELEALLRDSYANYVIQTAMDYASPETKQQLVDSIRPILPAIRMTPYGRRIQSKIQVSSGGSTSTGLSFPSGGSPGAHPPAPSRSHSYSQPSVHPNLVQQQQQQQPYPSPFRPDMASSYFA